ncbi:gephyrin-like molybdotransferase Glp [Paenalcaligenes sp. Me131]|uniref:molybdopterin molybdotransferase MoeA n=1 Tax=Paenalcaligenes sp. Me131 TaxID=3392636 RepID=UPI003D2DED28
MLDFDIAQQRLVDAGKPLDRTESVQLHNSRGRVLAETVHAALNIPPADNSAMDGYAIRFADYHTDKALPIQQRVYAGDVPEALQAGYAVRLFTGSLIPANADTVVIQELCSEDDNQLRILEAPIKGQHVRYAGEDMAQQQPILQRGTLLDSSHIAMLAAQGIVEVQVYDRLRVGILTTGNELTEPGQPLKTGQIYNSNASMLRALAQEMQTEVTHVIHAPDTLESIQAALEKLSHECDLVLTVGGVSVGDKDLVKPAIEAAGGELQLWKVRMKPGKPVALATLNNTSIIGLPGNPVSAYAVFALMVTPLVRVLQGRSIALPRTSYGKLDCDETLHGAREEFLRVQAITREDGSLHLLPYPQQGSGIISSLAWATGLARVPADTDVTPGTQVRYYDFAHWCA